LFLLFRKVFHSLSLLCASTMPSNGIAPKPSVPLKLPSCVAVSNGCSTLIGALNISPNSSRPWFAGHRRPGELLAAGDLADQRRDVRVVLVARRGLAHTALLEHARVALDDLELADVAAVFVE